MQFNCAHHSRVPVLPAKTVICPKHGNCNCPCSIRPPPVEVVTADIPPVLTILVQDESTPFYNTFDIPVQKSNFLP